MLHSFDLLYVLQIYDFVIGQEHTYELNLVSKALHKISQTMVKAEVSLQLETGRYCKQLKIPIAIRKLVWFHLTKHKKQQVW